MSQYRYIFADLLTNQTLAELQLTSVNFTQALNSAGTFQGSILLSGVDSTKLNVAAATVPARTAVYVDRDGILVWGGIIWSREYNSSNQHLSIVAREFESYWERRRITTTQTFFNTDQFSIVQALVSNSQQNAYANIGVQVPSNLSGVKITRTFFAYELKPIYQALLDLSRSTYGFDFNITVSYDGGGQPIKMLELLYPRSGKSYQANSLGPPVFEFPAGNMIEYIYPEDGSRAVNYLYAAGAGSNEGKQVLTATDQTKLNTGWPLLEDLVNYSDLTDQGLIQNLAQGQIYAQSYPPTTMRILVTPYIDPIFGTYSLGDDARIRIVDERFPQGIDATYRIVAINVDPGESSGERVTLTLTLPNATA